MRKYFKILVLVEAMTTKKYDETAVKERTSGEN